MSTSKNKDNAVAFEDRITGALYGFAIGDAMGATTEFMSQSQIKQQLGVVKDIVGGGWLHIKAGSVTDDTEMMLCVCRSLITVLEPFKDLNDSFGYNFMKECRKQFIKWMASKPIDVGAQCSRAIIEMHTQNKLAVPYDDRALGNGGLMRALPCALLDLPFLNKTQGRMTHNNGVCEFAVLHYHNIVVNQIYGDGKMRFNTNGLMEPTGHVINTLNNAMYWFSHSKTFEDAIVKAVNHGGDADTIAALTGGLVGAKFGINAIPKRWLDALDPRVRAQLASFALFAKIYVAFSQTKDSCGIM